MTCQKCGGLIIKGDHDGESKCVQCGKRVYKQEAEMSLCAEPRCRTQTKGAYCHEHTPDGISAKDSSLGDGPNGARTWSPERRAKFSETIQKRKGGFPKDEKEKVSNGKSVELFPWKSKVLDELDREIDQLESKIIKMREARESIAAL